MPTPYPKYEEKTVWFSNWKAGMATIDLDEYANPGQASYIQNADIWGNDPFLRPQRANAANTTGLNTGSAPTLGKVRGYAAYNGNIYAVDHSVSGGTGRVDIYSQPLGGSFGTWTAIQSDTSLDPDTEPPAGAWVQAGILYYFAMDVDETNAIITAYDIAGDAYVGAAPTWDNLDVAAWGLQTNNIGGFLQHTDGNTYIWKGRYLGVYDGTTLPSAVTPIAVPAGYVIRDAISYGNKILILARPEKNLGVGSNLSNGLATGAKLFIRDPQQNSVYTYDEIYDIKVPNPQGMRMVAGKVLIINADFDINIWEWLGGEVVDKVATLPVGYYDPSEFGVRWAAIASLPNALLFGTANTGTGVSITSDRFLKHGVYAYGFARQGDPWALHNYCAPHDAVFDQDGRFDYRAIHIATTPDPTITTVETGTGSGITYLFQTYHDNGLNLYRNSALQIGNTSFASNCMWESVWTRPFPGRKSRPLKQSLRGAGGTIIVEQKVDDDSGYTTIDTVSSFTDEEAVLRQNDTALTANFLNGHRHKFRFTLANSSSDKIEKIKTVFRTTQQER